MCGSSWTTPTVADFKVYFARDFDFAPSDDASNLKYVTDTDITRAIAEALLSFNETLFSDPVPPFLYLVAYSLVVNIQNSSKGLSSQAKFPISSTSVGGVSISYQIPDRYAKDPIIQQYAKNGYGMKYLEYALPALVGVASAAIRRPSIQ
jgi:hypothetical protein